MSGDRLTDAQRRRTNPDQVFGDVRFEYPNGVSTAERAAASAHFQSRADRALQLAGLSAPTIRADELMRDYRRRLMSLVQTHCDIAPELRAVEAAKLPREALPVFEQQIVDGAVTQFELPAGAERSCVRRDSAGREVTRFFGDPELIWAPCTSSVADDGSVRGFKVGRINTDLCTGRNSPEARAQRAAAEARQQAAFAALAREEAAHAAAGPG